MAGLQSLFAESTVSAQNTPKPGFNLPGPSGGNQSLSEQMAIDAIQQQLMSDDMSTNTTPAAVSPGQPNNTVQQQGNMQGLAGAVGGLNPQGVIPPNPQANIQQVYISLQC